MGDASDDVFEAGSNAEFILQMMESAGARRCICSAKDEICPKCDDLGWIDKEGNPCEP